MSITDGNVANGLTFKLSFTHTHKDGVDAMVYVPNVGGTQIDPNLATCHNVKFAAKRKKNSFFSLRMSKYFRGV